MTEQHNLLTLRELQLAQLNLLRKFDDLARTQGIKYSLCAGTLLGAVRHKGFIPWDDDLDIAVSRPDYERLLKLDLSLLPEGTELVTPYNSPFLRPFAKLVDPSIRAQESSLIGVMDTYLWIDIFPVDGVPSNQKDLDALQRRFNVVQTRALRANLKYENDPLWKRSVKRLYRHLIGPERAKKQMLEEFEQTYTVDRYDNSSDVCLMFNDRKTGYSFSKDGFENTVPMEFEGLIFPAMSCWDSYLVDNYGDYMTLPPESEQLGHHHIKAWHI